jgi:glycosidase
LAVRTPMQWTSGRNGGFSDAAPSRLPRPVVEGAFGPEHVNVADQRHDPDSLLTFITLLIRRYRESPELGWSDVRMLEQPLHQVLAHDCVKDDRRLVVVHNLSAEGCSVPLTLRDCSPGTTLVDLLRVGPPMEVSDRGAVEVTLEGYGYRWLRVVGPDSRRMT